MGYDVKIGSLRNYNLLLDELGQNVNPHHYIEAHSDLKPWDQGYMNHVWPVHDQIVKQAINQTKKIFGYNALIYRSAKALEDTSRLYEDNDDDNAATLANADSSIGAVKRPAQEKLPPREKNRMGLPSYSDHYPYIPDRDPLQGDAGRELDSPPSDPGEKVENNPDGDDPVKTIANVVDWLSPTHVINWTIKKIFNFDPVQEVANVFGGDWKAWWRCADVWLRVGKTHTLVAHEVWRGNARLDPDWSGNAADQAYAYFHQLAFAIKKFRPAYDRLWGVYRLVSLHVDKAATLVADGLKELGDKVVLAGLLSTPIGPALAGSQAVVQLRNIIRRIETSIRIYNGLIAASADVLATTLTLLTNLEKGLPQPYAMPAAYQRIR